MYNTRIKRAINKFNIYLKINLSIQLFVPLTDQYLFNRNNR